MNIPKNIRQFINKYFGVNVDDMEFIVTPLVKAYGNYNLNTEQICISEYVCPRGQLSRKGEETLVHEIVHYIQVKRLGVAEFKKTYATEKGKAFIESQADRYAFIYDSKYYLDTKMSKYRPINRG